MTPWTIAHQALPSMEFSRQEYRSGLPFPSSGDLPDPGIEPGSHALRADTLLSAIRVVSPACGDGGGLVAKPCLTLYDPMDCSLPGPPVHGILQARILEWVAISFSRGSSQLRN